MHPFASYVLRSYYKATGWNEDNLFTNLTRSSDAILDFSIPRGLHLSVSKSPNALFKTTYAMNAMPTLNGSIGYIFTSCDLDIKSSNSVRFKDMIDRFRVYERPQRPEGSEEVWLAGQKLITRDYLMYGRLYIPTGRLDALYSLRISPTLQAVVAAISDSPSALPRSDASNLMVSLQHDVGKWCSEYTYSAEDSMWGVKVLHNFGRIGQSSTEVAVKPREKRIDEEEPIEGGLRGRVSAGAELYFSAKEKSAGLSTGIRFSTLPDATPPSFQLPSSSSSPLSLASISHRASPPQPPTTFTALFNPMLGHVSAAYAARVSQDLSLSSRFDFNVYSIESEWTMGAEWWLRRSPDDERHPSSALDISLRPSPVRGVVKARASTNSDVSLMWEGRLKNMLVSLGVVSDFSDRAKPIKAIGLELSYFSSE